MADRLTPPRRHTGTVTATLDTWTPMAGTGLEILCRNAAPVPDRPTGDRSPEVPWTLPATLERSAQMLAGSGGGSAASDWHRMVGVLVAEIRFLRSLTRTAVEVEWRRRRLTEAQQRAVGIIRQAGTYRAEHGPGGYLDDVEPAEPFEPGDYTEDGRGRRR